MAILNRIDAMSWGQFAAGAFLNGTLIMLIYIGLYLILIKPIVKRLDEIIVLVRGNLKGERLREGD